MPPLAALEAQRIAPLVLPGSFAFDMAFDETMAGGAWPRKTGRAWVSSLSSDDPLADATGGGTGRADAMI